MLFRPIRQGHFVNSGGVWFCVRHRTFASHCGCLNGVRRKRKVDEVQQRRILGDISIVDGNGKGLARIAHGRMSICAHCLQSVDRTVQFAPSFPILDFSLLNTVFCKGVCVDCWIRLMKDCYKKLLRHRKLLTGIRWRTVFSRDDIAFYSSVSSKSR